MWQWLVPVLAIAGGVLVLKGYDKWVSSWVKPWLDREMKFQEIEDYANWGYRKDSEDD